MMSRAKAAAQAGAARESDPRHVQVLAPVESIRRPNASSGSQNAASTTAPVSRVPVSGLTSTRPRMSAAHPALTEFCQELLGGNR